MLVAVVVAASFYLIERGPPRSTAWVSTAAEDGDKRQGHSSALFVIGGDVKARQVHGKLPGLEPEQLYEGRDLELTTDFRSVFSEVASKHLGAKKLEEVFPGFAVDRSKWVGVL